MRFLSRSKYLLLPILLLTSCVGNGSQEGAEKDHESAEATAEEVSVNTDMNKDDDEGLLIHKGSFSTAILLDGDGDMCTSTHKLLSKNELVEHVYQRVGCNSDTCKQEFVTFAAIQYPQDSILQDWMAGVLSRYYYDVTRDLDIKVNGDKTEFNADGETELKNTGCSPYNGILSDGGKSMFDYYQARVWVIGRDRKDEHGPSGRYGCAIYRCWQSHEVDSWFVAYSTEDPQRPVHYVTSFDRVTGQLLDITDIIKEDYLAEFQDLLIETARGRLYSLRKNHPDFPVESGECDYTSAIQPTNIGFTEEGLAVSTIALPFDLWATATHVLIIPYSKANHLMVDRFRR